MVCSMNARGMMTLIFGLRKAWRREEGEGGVF